MDDGDLYTSKIVTSVGFMLEIVEREIIIVRGGVVKHDLTRVTVFMGHMASLVHQGDTDVSSKHGIP